MTTLAEAGLTKPPTYYDPDNGLECGALPVRPVEVPKKDCDCRVCRAVRAAQSTWIKSTPFVCPVCISRQEQYHGQLVFEGTPMPVYCSNHKAKIEMVLAR